jgi:hypothetical protein
MSSEIWAGEMIEVGNKQIVPFSRAYRFRLPFFRNFNFVWNRPTAVLVTEADGSEQIHPIHDVTRIAQIQIIATGLALSLLIWAMFRNRTRAGERIAHP